MLLKRLAERADQISEPVPEFYRPRMLDWILALSADGTEARVIEHPTRSDKNNRLPVPVPYVQRSGYSPPPMLLVDNAEYVLRSAKHKKPDAVPTAAQERSAEKRHQEWQQLTRVWAEAHPEHRPALALLKYLDRAQTPPLPKELLAEHLVGVMAGDTWLHEDPTVQQTWVETVLRRKGGKTKGLCLVCAEESHLLATIPHPVKKGAIPSTGNANEGQLVCVNKGSHERNGGSQLTNTPICAGCGARTMAALNELLDNDQHHRRTDNGVIVWWTRQPLRQQLLSLLDEDNPDPQTVAAAFTGLHKSPNPLTGSRIEENDFYAVTLGLNSSRIIIRQWLETPLSRIKANLRAWYDDHGVFEGWEGRTRYVALWHLAMATGRWSRQDSRYRPKSALEGIETDLFDCVLRGTPPPSRLLPALMQRIRADSHIDIPRIALLRLCLRRAAYLTREPLMPQLDPDNTQAPYLWGRAFAILEAIQRKALPSVTTGIGMKYFATAMTSPAAVFGSLRSGAQAHLKRLRRDNEPAAWALEARLTSVVDGFTAREGGIPAYLTPADQALFVIGYEQQRAQDKKDAAANSVNSGNKNAE